MIYDGFMCMCATRIAKLFKLSVCQQLYFHSGKLKFVSAHKLYEKKKLFIYDACSRSKL